MMIALLMLTVLPTLVAFADNGFETKPFLDWLELVESIESCDNLDPALVLAIIHAESNGNPRAIRDEGERGQSVGLMQIMAFDWRGTPNYLMRPEVNVDIGCSILDQVIEEEEGDLIRALARYNCGRVRMERSGCGTDYAGRIIGHYLPLYQRAIANHRQSERIEALMEIKRYPILN